MRPEFTRRTVLGLIAGSAAATVTGVSAGSARAAVPASPGVTYTNTIAEQRADPHITVEGIWAHVERSLANLAVVDAVDQRDEVALAHVPILPLRSPAPSVLPGFSPGSTVRHLPCGAGWESVCTASRLSLYM